MFAPPQIRRSRSDAMQPECLRSALGELGRVALGRSERPPQDKRFVPAMRGRPAPSAGVAAEPGGALNTRRPGRHGERDAERALRNCAIGLRGGNPAAEKAPGRFCGAARPRGLKIAASIARPACAESYAGVRSRRCRRSRRGGLPTRVNDGWVPFQRRSTNDTLLPTARSTVLRLRSRPRQTSIELAPTPIRIHLDVRDDFLRPGQPATYVASRGGNLCGTSATPRT